MTDITMCESTLCPNVGHCYRVQANPSEWKSMDKFSYSLSIIGVDCDRYIPMQAMTSDKVDQLTGLLFDEGEANQIKKLISK